MKELKPDHIEDIIAGVSLYRPGPMDQIPRYIRNKLHPDNIEYTHPSLEHILNVTYGCMVYQEQVMQIVRDLAGYSLGRADLVRRAMGKKKLDVMAKEREYFIHGDGNTIKGCISNGIDEASANKIFDEMAEFAKYAFNKSHAAAYSVVSYQTAYLKTYYPAEFMAAMLNSFLGNLDKTPIYIDECKRMNIEILKPDINKSFTKFTVDEGKIRFGLGSVKNVGIGAAEAIVKQRKEKGEFKDLADFCERIADENVNKKCIECLIKAGAFDGFNETRNTLLNAFEEIIDSISNETKKNIKGQVTLFELGGEENKKQKYSYVKLPEFSKKMLLDMEKEMTGIYISGHPLDSVMEDINRRSTINSMDFIKYKEEQSTSKIKDGMNVTYIGMVSAIKVLYTKKNTQMAFVTIEDLYGTCEVVVFEAVLKEARNILIEDNIVVVNGRISIKDDENISIVANSIQGFEEGEKQKIISINVKSLTDEQKSRLKGFIKFFNGEKNNMPIQVEDVDGIKPCGNLYVTKEIYKELQSLVGEGNVRLV